MIFRETIWRSDCSFQNCFKLSFAALKTFDNLRSCGIEMHSSRVARLCAFLPEALSKFSMWFLYFVSLKFSIFTFFEQNFHEAWEPLDFCFVYFKINVFSKCFEIKFKNFHLRHSFYPKQYHCQQLL